MTTEATPAGQPVVMPDTAQPVEMPDAGPRPDEADGDGRDGAPFLPTVATWFAAVGILLLLPRQIGSAAIAFVIAGILGAIHRRRKKAATTAAAAQKTAKTLAESRAKPAMTPAPRDEAGGTDDPTDE